MMDVNLHHLTSRSNKLAEWNLDEKVRHVLEGSGFDNPLVGNFRVDHSLMRALLKCYDPVKQVFSLGGDVKQDICFGLEDILHITGFPVDGKAVTGLEPINGPHTCEQFLGRNLCKVEKGKYTTLIPLDKLRKEFETVPPDVTEESFKYYVRAYVLWAIGCLIDPSPSGAHVSIRYLPLLEDIKEITKYAWGAAILAQLHWSFKKLVVNQRKEGAGFYYAMMVFALERLPRLTQEIGLSKEEVQMSVRSFPLASGWANLLERVSKNNLHKRTTEDWLAVLNNVEEDHIEWQPYLRLGEDFIPQSLRGQTIVGKSRTIVLCFEKAAYHRPDLTPKQFGLGIEFESTLREALVEINGQISRSGPKGGKDWSMLGPYKGFNEEWNKRHSLLIDFQGTDHQFDAEESDWGFTSLLPLTELNDPEEGFLVNDTIVLEASVTISNSHDSRKENGFEPRKKKRKKETGDDNSGHVEADITGTSPPPQSTLQPILDSQISSDDGSSEGTATADKVRFLSYWVSSEAFHVLEKIQGLHKGTFLKFSMKGQALQTMLLESFASFIVSMSSTKVNEANEEALGLAAVSIEDFEQVGLDLRWLKQRLEEANTVKRYLESVNAVDSCGSALEVARAKVRELEEGLAKAKAEVEVMSSRVLPKSLSGVNDSVLKNIL